ncbi:MAG: riboflavin synthase [Candidatus Omnitrophica bacterium]|nr:riboflavin synthase [Candidatus Omnitrophota bacterium]
MFTGIVETSGTVTGRSSNRLVIHPAHSLKGLSKGESVSVNGVCLTIDGQTRRGITFRLLPETVRVSTLGKLRSGDRVNLERAMKVGDRLGGHLMLGHVDGQGIVIAKSRRGNSWTLEIKIPASLRSCLVPKGPIGLDGVSLTLDPKIREGRIKVHLIPHTAKATTLGEKSVGEYVNVELDLIAKYLRRIPLIQ